MPTLLQVNTTLGRGSTGRIAEQIAEIASLNGWECVMAHGGRYVGTSKFESIQISSKADNYLHAIQGEFLGKHGLGSTIATKRFVKRIEKIQPDIVHLHNIHGYYIDYKVLFEYLSKSKIPIVWTLHDCWSFTGHCTHFENAGCDKWKTGCEHCPLLMAQYKSRIVDRSRKNYELKKQLYGILSNVTVVPVSEWLAGLVNASILGHFPVKVIHNGIDLNIFKPTENSVRNQLGIPPNKKMLLGVVASGFNNEKGKEEFVRLSGIKDYQIVLVGLSIEEQRGLPDSIICVNRTSNQAELAAYYSSADVFLNPTYNDTFPTTNLEALACGTPIVTYRTGGSPEALDEYSGIVVDKGNIDGFISAIDMICMNGKIHYAKKCRERAINCFDKNERLMDYVHLYNNLIQR